MQLTLVTQPAREPVSLTEVKSWAKIDSNEDDALLVSLIAAATQSAEQFLKKSLITQTWKVSIDQNGERYFDNLPEGVYDLPITAIYGGMPNVINLPRGPVQSVTSVTTYGLDNTGTTYASSNYFVDTAGDRLVLNQSAIWPTNLRGANACVIEYVTGYGTAPDSIPQPIRTAILMHIQKMYDSRMICELPEGCERLLRQYRHYGARRG